MSIIPPNPPSYDSEQSAITADTVTDDGTLPSYAASADQRPRPLRQVDRLPRSRDYVFEIEKKAAVERSEGVPNSDEKSTLSKRMENLWLSPRRLLLPKRV